MSEAAEKSKTATIAGVVGAVGVVLTGVAALLDGNPETAIDAQAVLAAVGAILAAVGLGSIGKIAASVKAVDDA
jgi:hypothetical protein